MCFLCYDRIHKALWIWCFILKWLLYCVVCTEVKNIECYCHDLFLENSLSTQCTFTLVYAPKKGHQIVAKADIFQPSVAFFLAEPKIYAAAPVSWKSTKKIDNQDTEVLSRTFCFFGSKHSEWMHLQDQRDQNRVAMQKQKFCLLKLFFSKRLGNNTVIAKLAHIVFLSLEKQGWCKTKKLLHHFFPLFIVTEQQAKRKKRGEVYGYDCHYTPPSVTIPSLYIMALVI